MFENVIDKCPVECTCITITNSVHRIETEGTANQC